LGNDTGGLAKDANSDNGLFSDRRWVGRLRGAFIYRA